MQTIHGVLVSVDNVGVLIIGMPGSGKSSLALDLLYAGHRLVSDDVIEVAVLHGQLVGSAPDRFLGALEVRGLGVLDAKKLFGEGAVIASSPIDICFELRRGSERNFEGETFEMLGKKVSKIVIDANVRVDRRVFVETAIRLFIDPSIKLSDLNDHPGE